MKNEGRSDPDDLGVNWMETNVEWALGVTGLLTMAARCQLAPSWWGAEEAIFQCPCETQWEGNGVADNKIHDTA